MNETPEHVARLRDLYAVLSRTNEAIIRATEAEPLYQAICDIAVDQGRFHTAWFGVVDDANKVIVPIAHAGAHRDFMLAQRPAYAPATTPPALALDTGRTQVINNLTEEEVDPAWRDKAGELGIGSAASLPVRRGGRPAGVLCVCSRQPGFFDPELIALLEQMAANISFALDGFERERIRLLAETALAQSERRYRNLFEHMSSGVAVYEVWDGGRDFTIRDVNTALEHIEKVSREDILGRRLTEVFPGVEAFGLLDVLRRVWRTGRPEHMDTALYKDTRISGWRENRVYRLPDHRIVAVYDDATERKQAEMALRENEQRLSLVLEATNDGFWDYDIANRKLVYSDRYAQLLGYQPGELPPLLEQWLDLVHPDDRPATEERFEAHLQGESGQFRAEHRMLTKSGTYRWLMVRGKVVERDADGRPLRMTGTHTDITDRKRIEQQLRLWSLVFSDSSEGIFITDSEARIVSVNRAFCGFSGYKAEELIGRNPRMLQSGHHDAAFYEALWSSLHETGRWQGEIWDRRKNGEFYPLWATLNELRNDRGEITNFIGIFTDISERKAAEERIRYLGTHDLLTGLPNRRTLIERIDDGLVHARRNGKHVAVLFVDLDRFKDINNSLGYQAGDRLLRETAERLGGVLPSGDTASRIGSDDFALALMDVDSPDTAATLAQEVIESVSRPFAALAGGEINITPSVGISIYPGDGDSAEALIHNAETAMHFSKLQGPADFQFFVPELGRRARERLQLQNDLRRAVSQGDLLLHYQPQVDAVSGQIVGAEALVRWRREERLVLPGEFIPLAEETGLIVPLGEWVLHEAMRQQGEWRRQRVPPLPVAVNIAAGQLHGRDLAEMLRQLLSSSGTDARFLEIELTERMLMTEADRNVRTLENLKAMGLALSIDDFGTGYSSLSYLRRFPIDRLKVDQSFVQDMTIDPADRTITEAIIALGRSLGFQVIAEGVETDAQADMLRRNGCHVFQGYHYGMPTPADEFAARIAARTDGSAMH